MLMARKHVGNAQFASLEMVEVEYTYDDVDRCGYTNL